VDKDLNQKSSLELMNDSWKHFEKFWHFLETIAEGSILEWCFTGWMRENTFKAKFWFKCEITIQWMTNMKKEWKNWKAN
jgi:hypothetical protein